MTAPAPAPAAHSRRAWRLASLLAAVALAASLALVGTSVAFLAAVALAGAGPAAFAFNFHHPAALVRFLALARTGARYGERLAGHRAALADQVARRAALFVALAGTPEARGAGWQLGRAERLSDYVDDVADIDYARLRVAFPTVTTGVALAVLAAATLVLAPWALPVLLALGLAGAGLAHRTRARLDEAQGHVRALRRRGSARLGATLAALVPLAAERRRDECLRGDLAPLAQAERQVAAQRAALARLEGALGIVGPFTAAAVLVAAYAAGARGAQLLPAAFLAFAWAACAEPLAGLSRALLGAARARRARKGLAGLAVVPDDTPCPDGGWAGPLALRGVLARTPAGRPIGRPLDLVVHPGRPVVLVGASGCGKTSLLKALAGWIGDDPAAEIRLGDLPTTAAERRLLAHLGLHDAAILADTVRENLFALDAPDAALWQALAAVELDGRVRDAGGLDAWIVQDDLSLGEAQRLNLARAWLSPAPLILFDEPTEHLGDDQAARILARLLAHWSNRVVVLASHRDDAGLPLRRVRVDGRDRLEPAA